MRKKVLSIWSVLLVLLVSIAVLVPSCTPTTGTIVVNATLDTAPWTGAVQYTLTLPAAAAPIVINGASVASTHSRVNPGSWTCAYVSGGPGTFVNITTAATQTVAAGGTITFTLNFVTTQAEGLDHFKFYEIVGGPYVGDVMPKVEDQFYTGIEEVQVKYARYFGNPVAKTKDGTLTPIGNDDHHLTLYDITTPTTQMWSVVVDNQFGRETLLVSGPVMLAVPTLKEEHEPPYYLDHYLLWNVIDGEDVQEVVDLEDQWHKESDVEVHRPVYFANPAGKWGPDIDWSPSDPLILHNPDDHMVLYEIVGETFQKDVSIQNQFHQTATFSVQEAKLLAVPSEKVSFEEVETEPLFDHFLSYEIIEALPLQAYVYLEDQFCTVEGTIDWPWWFCNPVEKVHEGVTTPIMYYDHHLIVYGLHTLEEPQHWFVNVNNQFGPQSLTVYGPVALAVPTQKIEPGGHNPPAGCNHYMLYEVVDPQYFDGPVVGLDDQFHDVAEGQVIAARYFANPVQKTDETGLITEIVNDQAHQVYYEIISSQYYYQGIIVANQFGEQIFDVANPICLVTPSQKISWDWLQ